MKKVLIIARYFGTRIPGLMKYLPEFGWQPVLLTMAALSDEPLPGGFQIIPTPYRDALHFWKRLFRLTPGEDLKGGINKRFGVTSKNVLVNFLLTCAGAIVNYPDAEKGWKPFAVKAGDELLQREKIDAIISSSSPVTAHVIASELKSRYKIPWVADLRDAWSQNHNYTYGPIRRWFDRRLELKTFSSADILITVSQPLADKLGTLHQGKPIYSLTNGFDPDEVNDPPVNLTAKMIITYTGNIYPGKQDPSKLFTALQSLLSDGTINPDDIEVRFYGPLLEWLRLEIERFGLSDIVKQCGLVTQPISLEKQREAQVLLLLDWDDPRETGVYTGKLFEYLSARRPVLATGGVAGNVVDLLLKETGAGVQAGSVEAIKGALGQFYREYKEKGATQYRGEASKLEKYTHREMTRRFVELIERPVVS